MRKSLILSAVLLCAACSGSVKSDFDCPVQQGKACRTVGQAENRFLESNSSQNTAQPVTLAGGENTLDSSPSSESLRTPEVLAKILFFPFIDEEGSFHEGGYVHIVIHEAHWKGAPR